MGTGVEMWLSFCPWAFPELHSSCSVLLASGCRKLSGVQGAPSLWRPVDTVLRCSSAIPPTQELKPVPHFTPLFLSVSRGAFLELQWGASLGWFGFQRFLLKSESMWVPTCSTFTFVHCSLGSPGWSLCGVYLGKQVEEQILSWINLGYHIWIHGKLCNIGNEDCYTFFRA